MSATIPIPFAIGETVWHAGYGSTETFDECPECAGTKTLTLIQGNGERVSLACACCSSGYDPSRGYVKRSVSARTPHPVTLGSISLRGAEITYFEGEYPSGTCLNPQDLFRDQAECQKRCDALNPDADAQEHNRLIANMMDKRGKMAWSVHYWGRKVKDLERNLKAARARLGLCKERKESTQ